MLIRNLVWRGIPMWPPEWWTSDAGAGEEGILEDVQFYQDLKMECVQVVASHLGSIRKGAIFLENAAHLKALYYKLKENRGKSLTMIGDMELDFITSLPRQRQTKTSYLFQQKRGKKV